MPAALARRGFQPSRQITASPSSAAAVKKARALPGSSTQEEGRRSLATFDPLRRVLATATVSR
jgi:hypothetical protein